MRYHNEEDLFVVSASDLTRFRECARANALMIDATLDRRERPPRVPQDVFARAGLRHEQAALERYILKHGANHVVIMDDPGGTVEARRTAAAKTLDLMASGVAVIHQAVLWWEMDPHTACYGLADFLVRQPDGRYQVIDAKLAKTVKQKYVVQVGLYADVLERMSGDPAMDPAILLGTGDLETVPIDQARTLAAEVLADFLEVLAPRRAVAMSAPRAHKNAACGYCAFRPECIEVWEQQGDLSLVAGIGAQTVEVYERVGIGDMDGLAAADEEAPPADVGPQAWRTHIRQSRLQARARREPTIPFEVLDGNVLRTLTPPSPGDIYFDIEGYAIPPIRLEYLFGMWDGAFTALWAHTAEEEARMLSAFIAYVSERRAVHPDLRIYYYNHYEVNALRRLADTYRIHQQEVEELCSQVMVNLMPIVKQSIMAGLPGYGLKELERLHGFERNSEVKTAGDSVDLYDRWLYDGNDPQLLEDIAAYNLEDLLSTQALHRWLAALA